MQQIYPHAMNAAKVSWPNECSKYIHMPWMQQKLVGPNECSKYIHMPWMQQKLVWPNECSKYIHMPWMQQKLVGPNECSKYIHMPWMQQNLLCGKVIWSEPTCLFTRSPRCRKTTPWKICPFVYKFYFGFASVCCLDDTLIWNKCWPGFTPRGWEGLVCSKLTFNSD